MKKATSIFVLTAVILMTTLSHVQLWKCLVNGDLLLSPECISEVIVQSCCSPGETHTLTIVDDTCCEKIHSIMGLNLEKADSSNNVREHRVIYTASAYLNTQGETLHLKKRLAYFNSLPPPEILLDNQSPLFISNCSFLC